MRNILTNPEDMEQFIKIVQGQIDQSKGQEAQLQEQLKGVSGQINEANNTIALLKNWQEIMDGDDMTLIKMAYNDIKKRMTKVVTVETE